MVADFVDEDSLVDQAGEWAAYVAKRIGNRDEVSLVRDPVAVLTPLFLDDMCKLCEKDSVVLFFDTFEVTGAFLGSWIRDVIEGRYGNVSANTLLCIAGRDRLEDNAWAAYRGIVAEVPLEPFSPAEAVEYLALRGVGDPRMIDVVVQLSGRLPLLVATLAALGPTNPDLVGDPSGTAVERFLKWVDDPERRRVAVLGALLRHLDQDVVGAVVPGQDSAQVFEWLKRMPFVERRAGKWCYHPVVRELMIRWLRAESVKTWNDVHVLAMTYYQEVAERELSGTSLLVKERGAVLEAMYHQLCSRTDKGLLQYLAEFLRLSPRADRVGAPSPAYVLDVLADAARDTQSDDLHRWANELRQGFEALTGGREQDAIPVLSRIVSLEELDDRSRAVALRWRSRANLVAGRLDASLEDIVVSDSLDPGNPSIMGQRGVVLLLLGRYAESRKFLELANERRPGNEGIEMGMALSAVLNGEHEEAVRILLSARRPGEPSEAVESLLAKVLLMAGRVEDALPLLESLRSSRDEHQRMEAERLLRVASVALGVLRGDPATEKGAHTLEIALAGVFERQTDVEQGLSPGSVPAKAYLPLLRRIAGQRRSSWAVLEALEGGANPNEVMEVMAEALRSEAAERQGRFEEALAYLETPGRLPGQFEKFFGGSNRKGLLLTYLGRYDEAVSCFEEGVTRDSADIASLYNRVVAAVRAGNVSADEWKGALKALLEASAKDASSGGEQYALAGIAALDGHAETAIELLVRAAALEPKVREWAPRDVAWLDLRGHHRFQELLESWRRDGASGTAAR